MAPTAEYVDPSVMTVWASDVSVVVDVPVGGSVPRTVPPPSSSLPVTGAEFVVLVAAALALLALGVVLALAVRRVKA